MECRDDTTGKPDLGRKISFIGVEARQRFSCLLCFPCGYILTRKLLLRKFFNTILELAVLKYGNLQYSTKQRRAMRGCQVRENCLLLSMKKHHSCHAHLHLR